MNALLIIFLALLFACSCLYGACIVHHNVKIMKEKIKSDKKKSTCTVVKWPDRNKIDV